VEAFLRANFVLVHDEEVPHQLTVDLPNPPSSGATFSASTSAKRSLRSWKMNESTWWEVMEVNTAGQGAYIYSSGKNTAVFKGVAIRHRSPHTLASRITPVTCGQLTPAPNQHARLVGGAHPLVSSIGLWSTTERFSSYGTNKRYLEMQGYHCTMGTDTEVMAYGLTS